MQPGTLILIPAAVVRGFYLHGDGALVMPGWHLPLGLASDDVVVIHLPRGIVSSLPLCGEARLVGGSMGEWQQSQEGGAHNLLGNTGGGCGDGGATPRGHQDMTRGPPCCPTRRKSGGGAEGGVGGGAKGGVGEQPWTRV